MSGASYEKDFVDADKDLNKNNLVISLSIVFEEREKERRKEFT